jgi:poly(3-hydroxybutyrate) depolymerase
VEERITLNIFVHDGPTGEDVQHLQEEMEGLRRRMGLLQTRLGEAQQEAAPPAARPAAAQPSDTVQLVINVVEAAREPAAAAEIIATAAEPVVLVLNVVEAPAGPPSVAVPTSGGACPSAASPDNPVQQASLAAQLQRVETCREDLARQAGQLRGRVAKARSCAGCCRCRLLWKKYFSFPRACTCCM